MPLTDVASAQATFSKLQYSGSWNAAEWTEAVTRAIAFMDSAFRIYGGYSATADYYTHLQDLADMRAIFHLTKDKDIEEFVAAEVKGILLGLPVQGSTCIGDEPVFVQTSTLLGRARRMR